MSGRRQKFDPVIAAWDRLQAAEKADYAALWRSLSAIKPILRPGTPFISDCAEPGAVEQERR